MDRCDPKTDYVMELINAHEILRLNFNRIISFLKDITLEPIPISNIHDTIRQRVKINSDIMELLKELGELGE